MANVLVNDLYLGDIADAIRSKLNTQATYKPSQMANAIESISGGGSSLGAKSITANGTYNASSDSLDGYSQVTVNVPQGSTPTGTKQISITENGTTTEDVTNYASAEITVDTTDGGKHLETGADICVLMGAPNWEDNKACLNESSTNPKIRRAVLSLKGTSDVYYHQPSGTTYVLSDLHLIPIPTGATKMTVTIDRSIDMAVREFIETNGTITNSVATTGWETMTPNTGKVINLTSGTQYLALGFRVSSSNQEFAYNTTPRKVVIDFS